jgi:hypothetical protein
VTHIPAVTPQGAKPLRDGVDDGIVERYSEGPDDVGVYCTEVVERREKTKTKREEPVVETQSSTFLVMCDM